MKDLLAFMEGHPDYPYYVLDGQTVLLEDYLEAAPEDRGRITDLIRAHRLLIGPWYTQTDEMAVSGESIARNLYWGYRDCRAFGDSSDLRMTVGYLPDSFGQCAQMPMILRQAGIPYSVFWRGLSRRHDTGSEFIWESDDGSHVTVQQLPLCYALGRFLPADASLKKRMDMTLAALKRCASPGCTDFVLPNGFDQMPVQKDIDQVISLLKQWYPDWDFVLDSYENACRLQESRGGLKTIRGEFLDGSSARVHRSIYSTRLDLKGKNTYLEQYITHVAEPLSAMAWSLGLPYPAGLYEKLWKELLKNHAHDSMGCCCSDQVHRAIGARYEDVQLRAEMLAKYAMRFIADHQETPDAIRKLCPPDNNFASSAPSVSDNRSASSAQAALVGRMKDSGEEKLLLFNTLPRERLTTVTAQVTTHHSSFILRDASGESVPYQILDRAPVDASLVHRELKRRDADGNLIPYTRYTIALKRGLPAFGYDTLYLDFTGNNANRQSGASSSCIQDRQQDAQIEDPFYQVRLCHDGSLDVLDKGTGKLYKHLAQWEDSGNAGDEYDYSPPQTDHVLTQTELVSQRAEEGPFVSRIHYRLSMPVYRNLKSGADDTVPLLLDCTLSLYGDGLIRFAVNVQNEADSHRLRLLFPTGISADCSHASQAFGEIARPVKDPCLDIWAQEKWEERPDGIYPMIDYVYLQNNEQGFGLLTGGGREYEIIGPRQDTIAFTVLSCTGMCGEDDLIRRPGRLSGIALPTPDAQMHRVLHQEFALALFVPAEAKSRTAQSPFGSCAAASQLYHWPVICWHQAERPEFALNRQEVRTPVRLSLFQLEGEAEVSAVKKAEESDAFLIRLYNASGQPQPISLASPSGSGKGQITTTEADLLEQPAASAQALYSGNIGEGRNSYTLLPNQMRSYLITL